LSHKGKLAHARPGASAVGFAGRFAAHKLGDASTEAANEDLVLATLPRHVAAVHVIRDPRSAHRQGRDVPLGADHAAGGRICGRGRNREYQHEQARYEGPAPDELRHPAIVAHAPKDHNRTSEGPHGETGAAALPISRPEGQATPRAQSRLVAVLVMAETCGNRV